MKNNVNHQKVHDVNGMIEVCNFNLLF